MKKIAVLFSLFALPILAYLFFSSGVNNFAKLPVLTENISHLSEFTTLDGKPITLTNKITVLGFFGKNVDALEGNAFNLTEKIYDKNHEFVDFQFIFLADTSQKMAVKKLLDELATTTNIKNWKVGVGTEKAIEAVFNSLQTTQTLDDYYTTPFVYIIDKERKLRGRIDDEDVADGKLYGYDTRSVAILSNKMADDVRVILAEYRLALKKYNKNKSE
ncbi:MAG: hypothetical protein ACTJGD_07865 [Mesonia hippocampi]|uniref:hypothetical protein n=1 Tax=Mesonia hippocampi TaxID=1628250 RepID=UPI003F9BC348